MSGGRLGFRSRTFIPPRRLQKFPMRLAACFQPFPILRMTERTGDDETLRGRPPPSVWQSRSVSASSALQIELARAPSLPSGDRRWCGITGGIGARCPSLGTAAGGGERKTRGEEASPPPPWGLGGMSPIGLGPVRSALLSCSSHSRSLPEQPWTRLLRSSLLSSRGPGLFPRKCAE